MTLTLHALLGLAPHHVGNASTEPESAKASLLHADARVIECRNEVYLRTVQVVVCPGCAGKGHRECPNCYGEGVAAVG